MIRRNPSPAPVLKNRLAIALFLSPLLYWPGIFYAWRVLMKKVADSGSVFRSLWAGWRLQKMTVFNRYYLPCHRSLTMYCFGWLKDRELAENAASETLIKLLEIPHPEEIEQVESWLFAVAKNHCLTLLEKTRRREEILNGLAPTLREKAEPDGEEKLRALDLATIIERTLTEKELAVWQLHQEGYDNREISERLRTPEKTIANVKSIARQKLRARLKNPNKEEKLE